MEGETNQFLSYETDDEAKMITKIRGVALPDGILFTPLDVPSQSRELTPTAVNAVAAAFRWGENSQRDANRK